MSAFSTLGSAKDDAARKAGADNGHSLGPWHNGHSTTWARCVVCGAEVTVMRSSLSLSGPALTARCKVPESAAGRTAA